MRLIFPPTRYFYWLVRHDISVYALKISVAVTLYFLIYRTKIYQIHIMEIRIFISHITNNENNRRAIYAIFSPHFLVRSTENDISIFTCLYWATIPRPKELQTESGGAKFQYYSRNIDLTDIFVASNIGSAIKTGINGITGFVYFISNAQDIFLGKRLFDI